MSLKIDGARRKQELEIPLVVLREAVVNAVAHRDYFEKGAGVMVEIFDNRVEISNPGGLMNGFSEEDFGHRTLSRNPLVTSLLHRAGFIEKLGTGVPRMRQLMKAVKLPEPSFHWNAFFAITLYRFNVHNELKTQLKISGNKLERVVGLLKQWKSISEFSVDELANKFQVTSRTIRNDLDSLEKAGWLRAVGKTVDRTYELTKLGNEQITKLFGEVS